MTSIRRHRFGDFILDTGSRSLSREGVAVALNSRYFDALALLVREHGQLVPKQRFFDEVWAGSVVTDSALTQCIKEIRRQLGDEAGDPRFVRTVPGHGYCFIAPVSKAADERVGNTTPSPAPSEPQATSGIDAAPSFPHWLGEGAAATVGGGGAGLVGGLLYGSALALSQPAQGVGSLSVLLVLLALCVVVGMAGAFGVGFGMAGARLLGTHPAWTLLGGAFGGFVTGALAKLLGSDALTLLVGPAPSGITGGIEGAAIGLAIATSRVLGGVDTSNSWRPAVFAALTTGATGAIIPLAGGSLMATSLARIAATFDGSRLDIAPLGRLFGDPQFGALTQSFLGATEGAIFGAGVVGALLYVRRRKRLLLSKKGQI